MTSNAGGPIISYINVSKSFGSLSVLKDVSLSLYPGQTTFIVGPSGCGKSVLTRMAVGLEYPDAGSIIVDGSDVTRLTERQMARIRRLVACVPQLPALFDSMTVLENLMFPLVATHSALPAEAGRLALTMLERFNLHDRSALMPSRLNQSERKMISIFRSMMTNPQCLILDEPTTGLDGPSRRAVDAMIARIGAAGESTVVVISHDMQATMSIADRIVFLYNGGIRLDGDRNAFLEASGGSSAGGGSDSGQDPVVAQFLAGRPDGPM